MCCRCQVFNCVPFEGKFEDGGDVFVVRVGFFEFKGFVAEFCDLGNEFDHAEFVGLDFF